MAQVANSAEKRVHLNEMDCSDSITTIDDSPSTKKMKQARLPFKPLGPKTQMALTPHGMPKKRKLSDQESPSAKAPKVVSKHQSDRTKLDVPERTTIETADHDNEVSSSSEAENIPLGSLQKRKESNILERFIRKSSQEEISSTNEVVDLTEDPEGNATAVNASKSDLEVASLKDAPKNQPDTKHANKFVIKDKTTKESLLSENEKMDKSVKVSLKDVELKNNDISEDGQTKSSNTKTGTETTCMSGSKMEETPSHPSQKECKETSRQTNASEDSDVKITSVESAQADKRDASETKTVVNKTDNLEDSAMSNKSQTMNKSGDLNTSSSSAKTESEEDSSESSSDSGDEHDESTADVSVSSQGNNSSANTSLCRTPVAKSNPCLTKTPGGSSVQTSTPKSTRTRPKSLKMSEIKSQERKQEREAMRQRIREQKERERQERKEKKEQERLEAKRKKEEEKAEKERKKNEEKEKKERERREKKEQVEREKMEKQQQKEEEKKKKQEQIDAKMEEKRKKEEEKKMKEEEKLKEEEEKNKKKLKEKESFTKFFIKKEQQQAKPKETSQFFMAFEVKKDMYVAPPWRRQMDDSAKSHLEECMLKQECDCLYVEEVKKPSYRRGKSGRTIPRKVDTPTLQEEDVECLESNEDKKKNLVRHRCKLLQFHTNYRPPYYGTWRKSSKIIKPSKPFNQDTELFDYEVDSDDEWEEEEPGESVSSSEDEGDEKEDDPEDEEEDGWMVPHGYLSEDEGCDQDEEITPEVLKARQMAKQEAWEAEQKRQKQPVRALVIGCVWDGDEVVEKLAAKLAEFQAICLSAVPIDTKSRPADCNSGGGKDGDKPSVGKGNRKPVPEEALPDLIRLLHGNTLGIKKLIKEFRLYWKKKTSNSREDAESDNMDVEESVTEKNASALDESCTEEKTSKDAETDAGSTEGDAGKSEDSAEGCGISKRQLEIKITSIAVREKRADFKKVCWYVHEKALKQYNMEELPLNNTWQYVSKGLIRVKNEEACGRRTPSNLSESFTDSVPIIMKEEEESEVKSLPKDQPSIMQFAKKMHPSELPPPKIRRIELKPANSTTPPSPQAKRVESPVADLDSSANEEVLGPYKTLPKDQRSIMDFAKKGSKKKNAVSPKTQTAAAPKTKTVSPKTQTTAATKTKNTVSPNTQNAVRSKNKSGNAVKKTVTPTKPVKSDLNQNPKSTVTGEVTSQLSSGLETSKSGEVLSPTDKSVVTDQHSAKDISNQQEEVMDTDDCIILD